MVIAIGYIVVSPSITLALMGSVESTTLLQTPTIAY